MERISREIGGGEKYIHIKKAMEDVRKRIAALEVQAQSQRIENKILWEFCNSVAYKEKLDLVSYQQLYSPSPDSAEKIRVLIEKIFKFGKHTAN